MNIIALNGSPKKEGNISTIKKIKITEKETPKAYKIGKSFKDKSEIKDEMRKTLTRKSERCIKQCWKMI